jgi:hypothetical protein
MREFLKRHEEYVCMALIFGALVIVEYITISALLGVTP